MNIKTLMIRSAQHLRRLARSIFGARILSVLPAGERRTIGGSKLPADIGIVGETTPSAINANTASPEPAAKSRRRNWTSSEAEVIPLEQRRWLTIRETSARFPCFSEKALRHLVAQAEAYANYPKAGLRSNGFIACIVRPAGQRKVIIDATKFEDWLASSAVVGKDMALTKSREQSARGSS
ncbi:MAG: hypothetical protein NTV11_00710 [Rhodocyclales bacterium]|nr:hypothetical protein [Rhodocyclales bacterium]